MESLPVLAASQVAPRNGNRDKPTWRLLFEPTVLSQNGHDKTEHTLTAQNERTHFSSMGDTVHAHASRYRTGLSAFTGREESAGTAQASAFD